jgi:hypothetical protein
MDKDELSLEEELWLYQDQARQWLAECEEWLLSTETPRRGRHFVCESVDDGESA